MRALIDTSAAGKLLIDEPESDALASWLDDNDVNLVGINLLETELRRLAVREEVDQFLVSDKLLSIGIHELSPSDYRAAGIFPGKNLRSLDALHLQGAVKLDVDGVVTYDKRMAEAAKAFGFEVFSPK